MTDNSASDKPATDKPADVMFYHLERQPLERVLPMLVEKTLERGWRAVIQVGSQERLGRDRCGALDLQRG